MKTNINDNYLYEWRLKLVLAKYNLKWFNEYMINYNRKARNELSRHIL